MTVQEVRVEVTPLQTEGMRDVLGDVVQRQLFADHGVDVGKVRSIRGYLIRSNYTAEQIDAHVQDIFSDPIIEYGATNTSLLEDQTFFPQPPSLTVTVGFKPGVTDNPGAAANDGFKVLFPEGESSISTYISYAFLQLPDGIDHAWVASTLFNGLIEKSILTTREQLETNQAMSLTYPERPTIERQAPATINLEVSDDELLRLSTEGLLALNLNEMQTIRDHYRDETTRGARSPCRHLTRFTNGC